MKEELVNNKAKAEEKPVNSKAEAEEPANSKAKAEEKAEVEVEVLVQYRGYEANIDDIVKRVKEQFIHKGNKESDIKTLQIYVKPEDFTAYFVINDGFVGKIGLF